MNRTIIVEGPNGSGKTTLVQTLAFWLPEYHVRPSRANTNQMNNLIDDRQAIARGGVILDRVEQITGAILAGEPPAWVELTEAVVVLCFPPIAELRKNCDYRSDSLDLENAGLEQLVMRRKYLHLMCTLAQVSEFVSLLVWVYTRNDEYKTYQIAEIIRLARGQ